jgi:DNA repair exonuclease SbcCD ATPase subunit
MLFLRNLRVENFRGFRGVHDFTFKRGFNVVEGAVGSGKTSLCRAIEFALFGAAWGLGGAEDQSLVNVEYMEECPGKRSYLCNVKLAFEYNGVEFRVERSFLETDYEMVSEDVYYSRGMRSELSRDRFHDAMYFDGNVPDSLHEGGRAFLLRGWLII